MTTSLPTRPLSRKKPRSLYVDFGFCLMVPEASRMSFQNRTHSALLWGSSSFERDGRVFPRRLSLPRPSPGLAADRHKLTAHVPSTYRAAATHAKRSNACRGPWPLCPAFPAQTVPKPPIGHPPEDKRVRTSLIKTNLITKSLQVFLSRASG